LKIDIIKGKREHLKDCEEALLKSTLGEHYFQSEGSAYKAIEEGLAQGNLYVAIVKDICVGFMFYITNGAFHSYPYLHLIVVKEEYRGKGIGKQLVGYFEKISDRDKFFLVVADFNPNAKRFYESIGYRQVGEIPGLYREGITEYIMMKEK
jgi:ribosomal protein S18 acetylase RimI-like enzyme